MEHHGRVRCGGQRFAQLTNLSSLLRCVFVMLIVEVVANLCVHDAGTRGIRLLRDPSCQRNKRITVVLVREEER